MKKRFPLVIVLAAGLAAGVSAAPGLTLKAPTVTSWVQNGFTADQATLDALNAQLQAAFTDIAVQLNTQYNNFDNLSGLDNLSRGFSNASMAAFDNASLLGYQNYDLFAVSAGFNAGFSVPTLDLSTAASSVNQVLDRGDVYAGLASGGLAAQVGVNMGGLVKNLYLTGKVGFIPHVTLGNNISAQQSMVGVGLNYVLMKPWDFGAGLIKWRGVSAGSGLIYNHNSIAVNVAVAPQISPIGSTPIHFDNGSGQTYDIDLTATTQNSKAELNINSTSVVVPVDLMTSVQLLWFLNLGLGGGVDLNFASTKIGLGASSDLGVTGDGSTSIKATDGSADLNVKDSSGFGSLFVPRLTASIGVDVTIFKVDVPVSFYPTTKSFAIGVTGGIVW
jgi:hypothetical protein